MSFPIDGKHEWMFHSNENFGTAPVSLKVEESGGSTILTTDPFFKIELTKFDSTTGEIKAEFRRINPLWPENSLEGEIIFKTDEQAKNIWSGFPTNIRGVCQWTILQV